MKEAYDKSHNIVRFTSGEVMWTRTPVTSRKAEQMWSRKCIIHCEKAFSGGYYIRWIDEGWGEHKNGSNTPGTICNKVWFPSDFYP
jgi:hypothetical protein